MLYSIRQQRYSCPVRWHEICRNFTHCISGHNYYQPGSTQKRVDEFDGNSTIVNADAMTLGYTPFGKPCIWTDQRQSGWHFYDSFIDDVAVWETALTDDEVRELYGGTSPTSPAMSDPRYYLRGYWPFVRGSGETVEDVAGISMSPLAASCHPMRNIG